MNVEYCASIKAMKYLFKYHFKGFDMATAQLTTADVQINNEVTTYQTKQYVSSPEAFWRIFQYDMVKINPPVMKLLVHLEGEQNVVYNKDEESAQEAVAKKMTTHLTEFFATNARNPDLKLKFEDFPLTFCWRDGTWHRQRTNTMQIGRVTSIHPSNGEVFYLRMLLKNVECPKSFKDICTVDGIECETFKEACLKLDLLVDDGEWHACMKEAATHQFPKSLRNLYCNIVLFCQVADPSKLFEENMDGMLEDFVHRAHDLLTDLEYEDQVNYAMNDCMRALNRSFQQFNKSNADFGLPMPVETRGAIHQHPDSSKIDPDARTFYDANVNLLNEGQQNIFHILTTHIDNNKGGFYNIDAPGGTGKHFFQPHSCP